MSSRLDTKTVMSSAHAEILARTLPVKETPRRAGRRTGHREEETGGNPVGPNARSRKLSNASRSPAPLPDNCDTAC